MYVKDAASVLGLQSDVGPLGDITVKPRVAQDFDLSILDPALRELKYGLDVGLFDGQHVVLARQLRDRIKRVRKTCKERERLRRCAEEKQASRLFAFL